MKKFFALFLVFSVLFSGIAFAQDNTVDVIVTKPDFSTLINSVSSVRTGVFYNINDSKFQFINTVAIYNYPATDGWLAVNIGYANENTFATSVTADVIQLSKWGINLPILKDVVGSVGLAGTFQRLTSSNEFAGGPVAQLKVKINF